VTLKDSKQEKEAVGFFHFSAVSIGSAVTNARQTVLMADNNVCFVKRRPPQKFNIQQCLRCCKDNAPQDLIASQ
jgi:hypothetical protein